MFIIYIILQPHEIYNQPIFKYFKLNDVRNRKHNELLLLIQIPKQSKYYSIEHHRLPTCHEKNIGALINKIKPTQNITNMQEFSYSQRYSNTHYVNIKINTNKNMTHKMPT